MWSRSELCKCWNSAKHSFPEPQPLCFGTYDAVGTCDAVGPRDAVLTTLLVLTMPDCLQGGVTVPAVRNIQIRYGPNLRADEADFNK